MLSTRLTAELGEPRSTLRAITQRNGSAVVIRAGGELDASNVRTWHHLVTEAAAVATAPGPFVVDLTAVDFIGCCAFAVLAEEAQRCRRRGIELRLVSLEPGLTRIVDACGLGGQLPVYPTTECALSAA
ncbi:anti-sigma factor antagonist [Mycobacterium shinjukuense]|uniref:Anti-sigma factor antagonist n=1 Tax=Mycobacterium shinjukuense TaxID=398694 RepID=A0A7I7MK21_9MYCO|nr:anti-sigma factor antagonist [Mycobacterium shinjukuense]MCV6985291.1 anti-sigma factor antagonist [Mycobacterium shinjukuense]BBX72674.1 anti-sigma factor antagonist [Mycobacterium shinjukuense]